MLWHFPEQACSRKYYVADLFCDFVFEFQEMSRKSEASSNGEVFTYRLITERLRNFGCRSLQRPCRPPRGCPRGSGSGPATAWRGAPSRSPATEESRRDAFRAQELRTKEHAFLLALGLKEGIRSQIEVIHNSQVLSASRMFFSQ